MPKPIGGIAFGYREYSGERMTDAQYAAYLAKQEARITAEEAAYAEHQRVRALWYNVVRRWLDSSHIDDGFVSYLAHFMLVWFVLWGFCIGLIILTMYLL